MMTKKKEVEFRFLAEMHKSLFAHFLFSCGYDKIGMYAVRSAPLTVGLKHFAQQKGTENDGLFG